MSETEQLEADDQLDPWLNPKDVAADLKVSVRIATRYMRREMPHFCFGNGTGRVIRVRDSILRAWQAAHTLNPNDYDIKTGEKLFDPTQI